MITEEGMVATIQGLNKRQLMILGHAYHLLIAILADDIPRAEFYLNDADSLVTKSFKENPNELVAITMLFEQLAWDWAVTDNPEALSPMQAAHVNLLRNLRAVLAEGREGTD